MEALYTIGLGVGMFTGIILALVMVLMFARKKLVSSVELIVEALDA